MATVEFKVTGRQKIDPLVFEPEIDDSGGELFRVRNLISKLVSESVRDFHHRERDALLQMLTAEKIAKSEAQGKFGRSREEAQKVELDTAIGQALQAFEDGLFLLFVDEEQKMGLEELVKLMPETRIVVVRLTALAGF